jgi:UDP:flavonoid glycosyltransferase YjiC (YdhE family)
MRLLFSAVPAHGHVLPLVPFVRAAAHLGHDVAVMTSVVMQRPLAVELPGVTFLAAGPDPMAIGSLVAERFPGADPVNDPQPETVAEFFAGARVDLAHDAALDAARAWGPDLVVVDAVDFVGPLVAAELDLPYAMVAFGPDVPPEFTQPMLAVVAPRYSARGLTMQPPVAVLDPAPRSFQTPDWTATPLTLPFRAEAYRRDDQGVVPSADRDAGATRPTVLVTLGTVFNDAALLSAILADVAALDVDVVATLGVQLTSPPLEAPNVRYEGFRPLAELLPGVDVVVTTGGAGTVLAAAAAGVPMVVIPQGADQFINAARAVEAGVAVQESDPAAVGTAVRSLLGNAVVAAAARSVQQEISERPNAEQVLGQLLERVR